MNEIKNLLNQKESDYCGKNGKYFIFESIAKAMNLKPQQIILMFIHTKVLRLQNIIQSETVNFESYDDNLKDLMGYVILLDELKKPE